MEALLCSICKCSSHFAKFCDFSWYTAPPRNLHSQRNSVDHFSAEANPEADRAKSYTPHQQSSASEDVSIDGVDISGDEPAAPVLVEEPTGPDARILNSEGLIVPSPDIVHNNPLRPCPVLTLLALMKLLLRSYFPVVIGSRTAQFAMERMSACSTPFCPCCV